jgi:hypothetical protein
MEFFYIPFLLYLSFITPLKYDCEIPYWPDVAWVAGLENPCLPDEQPLISLNRLQLE